MKGNMISKLYDDDETEIFFLPSSRPAHLCFSFLFWGGGGSSAREGGVQLLFPGNVAERHRCLSRNTNRGELHQTLSVFFLVIPICRAHSADEIA